MSDKSESKNIAWWVLLFAFVLTILLMFVPKEKVEINPNILPWNSHFNEQGDLIALGLTLNKSTPNDATKIFGHDYEILAFSKKDLSGKSVEVYFPTMTIANFRVIATLVLDVSDEELEEIYARGATTTINQSGNRQVNLLSEDSEKLMNNKIKYITLVPKKNLPEEIIKKRFGEPKFIEKTPEDLPRWFYPKKGLEIIVNPNGAEILQYYPSVRTQ